MEAQVVEILATVVAGAAAVVASVQKKVATALVAGGVALLAFADVVAGK